MRLVRNQFWYLHSCSEPVATALIQEEKEKRNIVNKGAAVWEKGCGAVESDKNLEVCAVE